MFNKPLYIDRLKRAGISDDQALAYAEAFETALRPPIASKTDLDAALTEIAARSTPGPLWPFVLGGLLLGAALFVFGMWVGSH